MQTPTQPYLVFNKQTEKRAKLDNSDLSFINFEPVRKLAQNHWKTAEPITNKTFTVASSTRFNFSPPKTPVLYARSTKLKLESARKMMNEACKLNLNQMIKTTDMCNFYEGYELMKI